MYVHTQLGLHFIERWLCIIFFKWEGFTLFVPTTCIVIYISNLLLFFERLGQECQQWIITNHILFPDLKIAGKFVSGF